MSVTDASGVQHFTVCRELKAHFLTLRSKYLHRCVASVLVETCAKLTSHNFQISKYITIIIAVQTSVQHQHEH